MKMVPTILSGGAGARLWPLSRQSFPKPFIALPQGDTLLRRTYQRALGFATEDKIVTVTNSELAYLTLHEYEAVESDPVHNTFLLEPVARDTAAAIALASLHVAAEEGEDALLLVLPADQLIADEAALKRAVEEAASLAMRGHLVTFGIAPTGPETGFGYIEVLESGSLRFAEKPDFETAQRLVEGGRSFWNAGIFCFSTGAMLAALKRFCPDILAGAREALTGAATMVVSDRNTVEIDTRHFEKIRPISIDYAVMEHADNLSLVACDCGWSDVGSWAAMARLIEPDTEGNRLVGKITQEGARNCYVQGQDRVVGLVGVQDLVVVDTPDALLIAHRDHAQDVRSVYARLKGQGHSSVDLHKRVDRPWGAYTVLEEGARYKIKRVDVKPGASLSLQAHHHRSEHWVVVSGTAKVINGDQEILLTTDQSTYIYCGNRHRLVNPGRIPLVMIEVQSGDYLGEDDIVRFDDVYGRA